MDLSLYLSLSLSTSLYLYLSLSLYLSVHLFFTLMEFSFACWPRVFTAPSALLYRRFRFRLGPVRWWTLGNSAFFMIDIWLGVLDEPLGGGFLWFPFFLHVLLQHDAPNPLMNPISFYIVLR